MVNEDKDNQTWFDTMVEAFGLPFALERLVSRRRDDFVRRDVLPSTLYEVRFISSAGGTRSAKEILEGFGVEFSGAVPGEPLVQASLPEGWQKRPTTDVRFVELLDDEDRVRAVFFFAVEKKHMRLVSLRRRFDIVVVKEEVPSQTKRGEKTHLLFALIIDNAKGGVLQRFFMDLPNDCSKWEDVSDHLTTEAVTFLDYYRPDWRYPSAYW